MKLHELIAKETLDELDPDPATRKALARLAAYDLSFLTNHFTQKDLGDYSPEQLFPLIKQFGKFDLKMAQRAELEFKKFIALTLLRPGRRNAPSGPVDMYWHFFVLHTRQYVKFCKAIWGEYGSQPRKGAHYFRTDFDKKREKDAMRLAAGRL